jgi:hypothetical protein
MRSIARCVLPVLVGPRTAVTERERTTEADADLDSTLIDFPGRPVGRGRRVEGPAAS